MLFIIWTLIILVLTLSQRRFTYMLGVNIAMLSGYFIYRIKFSYIILLILLIPNIVVTYHMSESPPKPSDEWYDSLVWMREHLPEYGVMAWWDYGNWILYISKKPVIANNFQIGGEEAARFFVATNESYANEIMKKRKARYVITDRRMGLNLVQENKLVLKGAFSSIAGFAGHDISAYLDERNLPNEKYFQTMYAKLHVFDGNSLRNYRMIYESKKNYLNLFGRPTKDIKIFEYISGARIIGNASREQRVSISGRIITNQKRIFYYHQETKADKNGYFEFIVPYSKDSPYETKLVESYILKYDNTTHNINVLEKDINGSTIVVK